MSWPKNFSKVTTRVQHGTQCSHYFPIHATRWYHGCLDLRRTVEYVRGLSSFESNTVPPLVSMQIGKCSASLSSSVPPTSSGNAMTEGSQWYSRDGASTDDLLSLVRQKVSGSGADSPGAVYLVGTGPGDPGLLTLKALRLMQTADVILYDRLVSSEILELVNPSAVMIYVGKQQSYHTRTQDEIHKLLCTFASDAGATVLRLKGGDPYVFGRGGEEVEYLRNQNVNVFVVPGITAAAGISAEFGIPMTHRGLATSVRFLTGHARDGGEADLDEAIASSVDPHTTLVVYMGLSTLGRLRIELCDRGLPPTTASVAIERGTTVDQRAVWAPLNELVEEVENANLKSPTLIVIGKVVSLAPGWQQYQDSGESLQEPGSQQIPLPDLNSIFETRKPTRSVTL